MADIQDIIEKLRQSSLTEDEIRLLQSRIDRVETEGGTQTQHYTSQQTSQHVTSHQTNTAIRLAEFDQYR